MRCSVILVENPPPKKTISDFGVSNTILCLLYSCLRFLFKFSLFFSLYCCFRISTKSAFILVFSFFSLLFFFSSTFLISYHYMFFYIYWRVVTKHAFFSFLCVYLIFLCVVIKALSKFIGISVTLKPGLINLDPIYLSSIYSYYLIFLLTSLFFFIYDFQNQFKYAEPSPENSF